jgi:hypothetical protein
MNRSTGLKRQKWQMPPGPIASDSSLGKLIWAAFSRLVAGELEQDTGVEAASSVSHAEKLGGLDKASQKRQSRKTGNIAGNRRGC